MLSPVLQVHVEAPAANMDSEELAQRLDCYTAGWIAGVAASRQVG